MARIGASVKVRSSTFGSESFIARHILDPVAASTTATQATLATDRATFEAALAVCVADGASPTQAHVTAANSAYTTLQTDIAALVALQATVSPVVDMLVSIDKAKIVSKAVFKLAIVEAERALVASGNIA